MEDDEHSSTRRRPAIIFLLMFAVALCDLSVGVVSGNYTDLSFEYIGRAELSAEDDALTGRPVRVVSLRSRTPSGRIPAVSRFFVRYGVHPTSDVPPSPRPAHELFCVYRI